MTSKFAQWMLFKMRERACNDGRITDVDCIDVLMHDGLDAAAKQLLAADFWRYQTWGEYPSFVYCDACGGALRFTGIECGRCECVVPDQPEFVTEFDGPPPVRTPK